MLELDLIYIAHLNLYAPLNIFFQGQKRCSSTGDIWKKGKDDKSQLLNSGAHQKLTTVVGKA
jgi:hypothetical protein